MRKPGLRAEFSPPCGEILLYHATDGLIVFAWVNAEDSKRYDDGGEAVCRMFRKMLESGDSPADWRALLAAAPADGQGPQRFVVAITS